MVWKYYFFGNDQDSSWFHAIKNCFQEPGSFAKRDKLEDLGHLVHDMMAEGVAVAKALGIELSSDPWAMNCQAVSQGGSHGTEEYAHITSMLSDVRNQSYTEVDWITGSIVRAAHEAGVPAPFHETLYRLVKGIEKGWPQS